MHKQLLVAMAAALGALSASGKDLGVQGQLFPINEIDVRQLMLESAARADWDQVRDEVKDSANKFFDSLPKRSLPSPDKTHTRYIDPSISTGSDIMVPAENAAGDYQWTVMYPKGTRINPLDTYRPLTAMLFFDGHSEAQLRFVREALAANPMRIVPVETAGANVKDISKAFKRPIFYASDAMMARFKVTQLPALLYPATGDFGKYLGLTAFGTPYRQAELESVWPSHLKATQVIPLARKPVQ
jgi:conjugal transfer pilus assembly protein TraW